MRSYQAAHNTHQIMSEVKRSLSTYGLSDIQYRGYNVISTEPTQVQNYMAKLNEDITKCRNKF